MSDCPHGLDTRWCATCKHGPTPRQETVSIVATFGARYGGECPVCSLPIAVGARIAKLTDDTYVHVGCAP